jgi:hypothetical protein
VKYFDRSQEIDNNYSKPWLSTEGSGGGSNNNSVGGNGGFGSNGGAGVTGGCGDGPGLVIITSW